MKTEAKAKVVPSIWGAKFGLEEKVYFVLFFQIVLGKTASAARNYLNFAPQTDATTFAFAYFSILLL